uniref:Stc1 domain-containing protein n=1 Tax=Calcidiscus leptoporus TaxID=127549 RepID=A0A7S0JH32_9EUKA|mmetsp:Transcript_58030/g.133308  ORF Transcript_58030/g.133308 Transcript_58030/m.133308 type:complete len:194 (+) Transcript_58030:176-757(+)
MSQWAGSFDCAGECHRKRLVGSEFSKAMLEKRRKDASLPIRCKSCVEEAAVREREQAAKRQAERIAEGAGGDKFCQDQHTCSACEIVLPASAFNRTQLSKGTEKQRCQQCVGRSEQEASAAVEERQKVALADAKAALRRAEASGSVVEKLTASATHAALEAERVTGLKPVILGRGGRGRGRGSWRGRAGGGRS